MFLSLYNHHYNIFDSDNTTQKSRFVPVVGTVSSHQDCVKGTPLLKFSCSRRRQSKDGYDRAAEIQTNISRRVSKELLSYEKEESQSKAKAARMHENGADACDIKQQENVWQYER